MSAPMKPSAMETRHPPFVPPAIDRPMPPHTAAITRRMMSPRMEIGTRASFERSLKTILVPPEGQTGPPKSGLWSRRRGYLGLFDCLADPEDVAVGMAH